MASVDVVDVRKAYGAHEVIHGVSIGIRDGEFVILVGPSGCGKSTLLRMIAGLEAITKGDIRIAEKLVNDLPPEDREIAMVFQNYALCPHKTVAENMSFALKLRRVPKAEVAVIESTGSETQIFAGLGGQKPVHVFRERATARPCERLPITAGLDAVHLLDETSGRRLN